jgi:uncharacterized protein (DUF2249 family)/hemerythrin superfamily protein
MCSQDRPTRLLSAFDTLPAGQTLLLVSSDEPWGLLETLQLRRKGLFEWSPLTLDPRSWQVEITRRDARPGERRCLTEALHWEHVHLGALEQRAFEALVSGDRDTSHRLYAAYQHGLNRHIHLEEQLLFPVFEMKSGLPYGGPTAVMRAEHREIRMALEELIRAAEGGPAFAEEPRSRLHTALRDHERKEESILYPNIDRLLTDGERDSLVARVQAYSR